MSSWSKQGSNILYFSKRRRCTHVKSYVNLNKSSNLDKSNSDNVTGNSNLPCINSQTESSFNTLINMQKETDTESSIIINDEIIDETI